jgi:hypothetical protein
MERTNKYSIDEIKLIENNWINLQSDALLVAKLMNQIHPEKYILYQEILTIEFDCDNKTFYVYSRKYNTHDSEGLLIPIEYLSYDDEQIKSILIKEKEEFDSMSQNLLAISQKKKEEEDYQLFLKLKKQFENHE